MPGIFELLKRKIVSSFENETVGQADEKKLDGKIVFGVLLWFVAEADGKFLPEEKEKIKAILTDHARVEPGDIPVIMAAIQTTAQESVDIYRFTMEIDKKLEKETKISVVENLFRIACADGEIDPEEMEMIRKISKLIHLYHEEFIQAKISVKAERKI